MLAALLILIALRVYLPPAGARVALALAAVMAAVIWVAGQALGGILTGSGTDPDTAPLLALLVLAFWPGARADGAGTICTRAAGRTVTWGDLPGSTASSPQS